MSVDDASPARRGRRPNGPAQGGVAQQILQATASLLHETSHLELTDRRIAAAAGVDEAMIRYYFGGKDGLLLDLTLRHCDKLEEILSAFSTIDARTKDITRKIISVLVEVYFSDIAIMRIMLTELVRKDSLIRTRFIARFGPVGPEGLVAGPLQQLIERLQNAGVYRTDAAAFDMAISMISTIAAPILISPLSGAGEANLSRYSSASWIAHITALFDARLIAADARVERPKNKARKRPNKTRK